MFDPKVCIFPFFDFFSFWRKKDYINLRSFNEDTELAFGVIYSGFSVTTSLHFSWVTYVINGCIWEWNRASDLFVVCASEGPNAHSPFWSPNSLSMMLQCLSIELCLWSLRFLVQKIPLFPQNFLQVLTLLAEFILSSVHTHLFLWLCCRNPYCRDSSLKRCFK